MEGQIGEGTLLDQNNLLRALRAEDAELLRPLATPWWGHYGDVLFEPGSIVRQVYFPCGPSLVSYLVVFSDGRAVETALIGREGAVGGIVSQGRLPAYSRAEVYFPGPFLRIELSRLEDAKMRSLTLRHLFARYADCLMAQVYQAVACNAVHTIEQRAAKWLVAAIERIGTTELPLVQEQLAAMMGVGRSYLSRVLGSFRKQGVLSTRRGRLAVTDFERLKAIACECNDCVRRHFDQVLKGVYPDDEITEAGK